MTASDGVPDWSHSFIYIAWHWIQFKKKEVHWLTTLWLAWRSNISDSPTLLPDFVSKVLFGQLQIPLRRCNYIQHALWIVVLERDMLPGIIYPDNLRVVLRESFLDRYLHATDDKAWASTCFLFCKHGDYCWSRGELSRQVAGWFALDEVCGGTTGL